MIIEYQFVDTRDICFSPLASQIRLIDTLTRLYNQLTKTEQVELNRVLDVCKQDGNQLLIAYDTSVTNAKEPFDSVVGVASLIPIITPRGCNGYIEDLVVDQSYRRQGIGSQLVLKLLEAARKMNMGEVILACHPDRHEANEMYRKLGFTLYPTNFYRYCLRK